MLKIRISAGDAHAHRERVWHAAAAAGRLQGLNTEQKRSRFLRTIRESLGPAQFQHATGHCEEVARVAARLASLMQMDADEVGRVRLAGLLHDLGKVVVPEAILAKPGPLSRREREVMTRHAEDGGALSALLGADEETAAAVRHHHTRFDVAATSLAAQVVCVADAVVTMTSDRPYSAARSYTDALVELRLSRATMFNPEAVVAAHVLGAAAMARAA
jgi:putative nucleotidyltransferase with HDIG domain